MKALGVDPGLSGALAIVEFIGGIPVLVDTIDMPSTGTGAKARVDIIAAASWIAKHAPSTAYVERAQAFPGQGASSGFSHGRSVGAISDNRACRHDSPSTPPYGGGALPDR
jgi:hypothetical protein